MSAQAPKKISQPSATELAFTWSDDSRCVLPLELLRQECPCANCKGETILFKTYKPLQLPTFTPGMYELAAVEPVGSYGVRISWKDGHDTGIYSWEYLDVLCKGKRRKAKGET